MGKVDAISRKMASKSEDETIVMEFIVGMFEIMESEAPKIQVTRYNTARSGAGNITASDRVGQVGLWTCEQRLEGNTTRILCRARDVGCGCLFRNYGRRHGINGIIRMMSYTDKRIWFPRFPFSG
jgi:hypothetical protein